MFTLRAWRHSIHEASSWNCNKFVAVAEKPEELGKVRCEGFSSVFEGGNIVC